MSRNLKKVDFSQAQGKMGVAVQNGMLRLSTILIHPNGEHQEVGFFLIEEEEAENLLKNMQMGLNLIKSQKSTKQ